MNEGLSAYTADCRGWWSEAKATLNCEPVFKCTKKKCTVVQTGQLATTLSNLATKSSHTDPKTDHSWLQQVYFIPALVKE